MEQQQVAPEPSRRQLRQLPLREVPHPSGARIVPLEAHQPAPLHPEQRDPIHPQREHVRNVADRPLDHPIGCIERLVRQLLRIRAPAPPQLLAEHRHRLDLQLERSRRSRRTCPGEAQRNPFQVGRPLLAPRDEPNDQVPRDATRRNLAKQGRILVDPRPRIFRIEAHQPRLSALLPYQHQVEPPRIVIACTPLEGALKQRHPVERHRAGKPLRQIDPKQILRRVGRVGEERQSTTHGSRRTQRHDAPRRIRRGGGVIDLGAEPSGPPVRRRTRAVVSHVRAWIHTPLLPRQQSVARFRNHHVGAHERRTSRHPAVPFDHEVVQPSRTLQERLAVDLVLRRRGEDPRPERMDDLRPACVPSHQ